MSKREQGIFLNPILYLGLQRHDPDALSLGSLDFNVEYKGFDRDVWTAS